MRNITKFNLFILLILSVAISGCDKHHSKKLSGTYSCKVSYNHWDMTPSFIDTTYNEDILIEQDGKYLLVMGYAIHIDSLRGEKEYNNGYLSNYMKVIFRNDSIYLTKSSGGLGGNSTWDYQGRKK